MNKIIIMMSLVFCSQAALAKTDFKHFELTHSFKQKLHSNSQKNQVRSQRSPLLVRAWELIRKLGINATNELTQDIINYNNSSPLGRFNKPEMKWNSGINGGFGITLGRRIEPTLAKNSKKWQVYDELSVSVSAYAFLSEQRTLGNIRMTNQQLGLFSGIFFTRKYNYIHFTDSYFNGLSTNFNKLFLSFEYFEDLNFLKISNGELITKSDSMTAKIGLALRTPSVFFISGFGRGTIYTSKIKTLSYYRKERTKSFQVTKAISKPKGNNFQLGVQADFYGLLKVTLLGLEYNEDFTKTNSINMTLNENDVEKIKTDKDLKAAFVSLNNGKDPNKIDKLKSYITSKEQGNKVREELRLFFMKWGKHKGSFTEDIVFEENGNKHYFYRHGEERVKLNKSWWNGIFRASRVNKYKTRDVENMSFEYKAEKAESNFKNILLEKGAPISFRLSKQFHTKKNKSAYRRKAIRIMENLKEVDREITDAINSQKLKAPILIDLHAQVGREGIKHLLSRSPSQLRFLFTVLCNEGVKCIKGFEQRLSFIQAEYRDYGIINMYNIKNFLQSLSGYIENFQDLKPVFGAKNIMINGLLKAKTRDHHDFQTFFSEGSHQGYGVIKDFIKLNE